MSKLISSKQLDAIHAAQTIALNHGNHAAYWALALAIDFALSCNGAVDKDIERVNKALLQN